MEKFCKYCGKGLENENCDCAEAVAEAKLNLINPVVEEAQEVTETITNTAPQIKLELPNTPEIIEGIVSPINDPITMQPPTIEPGSPEIPVTAPPIKTSKVADGVSKTANNVGTTFISFLTHPIKTAATVETVPALASIFLVLIQALAFVLFSITGRRNFSGSFPSIPVGILIPIVAVLAAAFVLFLALFLLSKLTSPTLSLKGALGTVGLSTIPWILCMIVLSILSFFLFDTPNIIAAAMIFAVAFSAVFSTLIIERGANSRMNPDGRRLFVVSLSVALQVSAFVIVYFLALSKFTKGIFM